MTSQVRDPELSGQHLQSATGKILRRVVPLFAVMVALAAFSLVAAFAVCFLSETPAAAGSEPAPPEAAKGTAEPLHGTASH
ncbi:hypothetical protein [Streptomyces corynorhini]|uniref:Uncharacterized protein n=1 Tax=Streptomyces corynorhini TaxID=2282652 RepID=A0A370AZV3_9ACTN|nr:hypothetical protein [Streptomyces corynorhini]RDG32625.1 hypothetical protein DVH02_32155 [Streptomyces corynorhini]